MPTGLGGGLLSPCPTDVLPPELLCWSALISIGTGGPASAAMIAFILLALAAASFETTRVNGRFSSTRFGAAD
jgi:hypothetical protein